MPAADHPVSPGLDGLPESTTIALRNIPPGRGTDIPVGALNILGFRTIQDIFASAQITVVWAVTSS